MIRIIKLIIWIFVIIWIIFYIQYKDFKNEIILQDKIITVISWDTLVSVLNRELWFDKFYLKVYLNLNPEKKIMIQSWEYKFLKWENIDSIIQTINYWAKAKEEKIIILEWWNIFDIDEYFTKKWFIQKWDFILEAKNIDKYKNNFLFLKNALTLEWYLYPDTYFINPDNFNIENFNKTILQNFNKKVYKKFLSNINENEINEKIILASIIEKEEKNILQKPIVAWILLKRLKEKWFIWADITACYAFELTSKECQMNLSKYINEKNDYNTRTMVWLPKTPINNPHLESIKAVLNADLDTPYWYYLHDTITWKIYYSKTNEEHNINKSKYIK